MTLDDDTGSQQPKRKRRAGKKGPARLALEPCRHCIDQGELCEEPPAGSKGTACKRCARLHITCKRAQGDEDEDEEEVVVVERKKRMQAEVVIPVPAPPRAVIGLQLNNTMWALIERMSEHLGAITHEVKRITDDVKRIADDVKRIADDVKEVQDSRRAKARPQAGVQTEEKETAEAGVEAEEGGEKGSEDGEKDGEGEKETEE